MSDFVWIRAKTNKKASKHYHDNVDCPMLAQASNVRQIPIGWTIGRRLSKCQCCERLSQGKAPFPGRPKGIASNDSFNFKELA